MRTLHVSGIVSALLAAASWPAAQTTAPVAPVSVTGDLRLHQFRSTVFGNVRQLRVLVPEGYDAAASADRRYPVLYLNDGQNLFDVGTSTFTALEWEVDETLRRLVGSGAVPPLLVVGIDHAGRRERFHEYFPWPDEFLRPPDPDPQGRRYPEFLVDEVVPFIESRYRVTRQARLRGLGGSSAGALAALHAVQARPGVFGRLLVESPSLYVDDAHVLRDAARATTWPERVWLGVGTNEGNGATCDPAAPPPPLVRDVRRLEQLLRTAPQTSVRTSVVPCARHDEAAWAARLPDALRFLYGDVAATADMGPIVICRPPARFRS